MKTIRDIIESLHNSIDMQWINDENPVCTADGREVKIDNVDYSEVPNKIIGIVKDNNKELPYVWDDTGKCIEASDRLGNPIKPSDNDNLIKKKQ